MIFSEKRNIDAIATFPKSGLDTDYIELTC